MSLSLRLFASAFALSGVLVGAAAGGGGGAPRLPAASLDRLSSGPSDPTAGSGLIRRWHAPDRANLDWFPDALATELLALDQLPRDGRDQGPDLRLRARSVFVYDVDRGEVLLSRGADDRRPVASLTKLVSALAMSSEQPDLNKAACLDQAEMPSWPGAVSRLRPGLCTTGWDLLGAALVRSDNGAAYALADVAGLPLEPFVERMNEVAAELGMESSEFVDPAGLMDENLSTARDMTRAILAASLLPTVSLAASASSWEVHDHLDHPVRLLQSTTRVRGYHDIDLIASKTGYTDTARHCFSAVIRLRDGRRVAITTLGTRSSRLRWRDARALVRWLERRRG